jgi:ribonuclease T2
VTPPNSKSSVLVCLLTALAACTTAPPARQKAAAVQKEDAPNGFRNGNGNGDGERRHRHRNRKHGRGGNADGPADAKMTNVTGNFDYYLLSLSWSPGFCATPAGQNDPGQCAPGRKFSFVLHGLWPQYERSGWPEDCSTEGMDGALVDKMLPIMPSDKLIHHEWSKHGTCSGLTPKEYFDEADEAFHSIKIPAQYQTLAQTLTVDPAEIRSQFAALNPKVGEQGFVVECSGNGRYLSEVHACLTKDLDGRACNRAELVHQCKSPSVVMRPVR